MWILLSRMTCPQRAISLFNSAFAAAGERWSDGKADTCCAAQILTRAGSDTAFCNALLSVAMIESGVLAGANMACQYTTSSFGPNVSGKLSAVGNSASFSFEVTP